MDSYLCGDLETNAPPLDQLHYNISFTCLGRNARDKGNSPFYSGSGTTFLSNWGHGPIIFPKEAGLRIGDGTHRYIVIEVHLDDVSKQSKGFQLANVGLRIHTTTNFRKFDASTMLLGDLVSHSYLLKEGIPGMKSNYHFETTCVRECTKKLSNDLIVFGSILHMHKYGRETWSTLYKYNDNGDVKSKQVIDSRQFWNFGLQLGRMDLNLTISPGDSISTHCVYDTTKRSTDVFFGTDSTDEMCVHLIFFYSTGTLKYFRCEYIGGLSLCDTQGNAPTKNKVLRIKNPIPDGDVTIPLPHFAVGK